MAHTRPKLGARLTAWALAAVAGVAVAEAADPMPDFSGQPVKVEAAGGSQVDLHTREVVLKNVVISQGNMRVSADRARATGLDFANSRWNFEGNVHIDAAQSGKLHSDQAIVEFKDYHIARATITGKPAEFEQKRANTDQIARGHADEILYDVNDGTVRLENDAWLCDGQNQISGPLLVYNIREQQIKAVTAPGAANGAADQRVRISIVPHPAKTEATGCEAPKPQDAPPAPPTEPSPKS